MFRIVFLLACLLIASSVRPVRADDDIIIVEWATPEQVQQALSRLDDRKTRLEAMQVLLPFASMRIYQVGGMFGSTGNAERDELITRVAERLRNYRDFETVRRALNSSNKDLQFWACTVLWRTKIHPIEGVPRKIRRDVRPVSTCQWKTLLPRLRELAGNAEAGVRGMAQNRLINMEGEAEFLRSLADRETDVFNIERLIYWPHYTLSQRMQPHLLRLLNHEDISVRRNALSSIGFNSDSAPMWQLQFDREVFQKVMELSRSAHKKERATAVYALEELRNFDPDAIRKRMFEIAADVNEVEGVRWRIAWILQDQTARPDVRTLILKLLHDPSELVRKMTLMPLDPAEFREEFERVANDSNDKNVEFARRKLAELDHPATEASDE